jgi:hypothetical protein
LRGTSNFTHDAKGQVLTLAKPLLTGQKRLN